MNPENDELSEHSLVGGVGCGLSTEPCGSSRGAGVRTMKSKTVVAISIRSARKEHVHSRRSP